MVSVQGLKQQKAFTSATSIIREEMMLIWFSKAREALSVLFLKPL